jgi:outer membrane protein
MLRIASIALFAVALAATGAAQTAPPQTPPAGAPEVLRLTAAEAVKLALDRNVDLRAARMDPQISDMRVAAAAGAFKPVFATSLNRNNQLAPPSSFLIPTATRTDAITSNVALSQKLPWLGTSYSFGWTTGHTASNSFLSSYNPLVQSGLSVSVSQPLVRDLFIDAARMQLRTNLVNRDIADTRLREDLVHTTAAVKAAYWNLVAARAYVTARQSTLDLARELARVNQAKVDVGEAPPLDLVSAQAEVAADEEQLIVAETAVKQTEDALRLLILDPTGRDTWTTTLEPIDSPPVGTSPIDLDAAVANALQGRADLARARKDIENAETNVKFTGAQRLPDVRLNAAYQANGIGGTQVLRTGGFPGTIVGPGDVVDFGSVIGQLFRTDYPTWAVGVSVSYPVGTSVEDANFARARLERAQADERLKSDEAHVIQQVRDAAWKIEMNAKRIETTRAARALAEQRLDAERKRFDVGMSTSFLVIQAQRDLAQARTNELASVLAYDLALVDFEAVQQASPAPIASQTTTAR